MSVANISISFDEHLLNRIDGLVESRVLASRSQAIQMAVRVMVVRLDKTRLVQACAKLDPAVEQAMADEGRSADVYEWPEY